MSKFAFWNWQGKWPTRPWITAVLATVALSFITNFWYLRHFGLYEDDYIWVMTLFPLNWSASDLHFYLADIWHRWILYQGRPLGFSSNVLLVYAGRNFSSLAPGYLWGYLIQAANALALLALLGRAHGRRFALIATIAYFAFPADASRQLLMHRQLHLSESFVLAALLFFQRGHRTIAYSIAVLALITYESYYLPFLFAPFIVSRRAPSLRSVLSHIVLFFAVAAALLFIRSSHGDDRSQLITGGLSANFLRMVMACAIGLGSAFGSALSATRQTFASLTVQELGLVAMTAALVAFPVWHATRSERDESPVDNRYRYALLVIFGMATAFTYILSFRVEYFPPTTTIGRLSGLNAAAAVPFGLVVAMLDQLLVQPARRWYRPLSCVIPLFLITWVLYGVHIQQTEYVTNWELQQKPLWKLILKNSGNLSEETPILVEMETFPRTKGFLPQGFIEGKAFGALEQLVVFPPEWKTPPRVYGYSAFSTVSSDGNKHVLHAPQWNKDFWPILRDDAFFLIKYRDGQFSFSSDSIELSGMHFRPKQMADVHPPRPLTRAGVVTFGNPP